MAKKILKSFLIFGAIAGGVVILILLLFLSACFAPAIRGQLVDSTGKPLQGAFVLYVYSYEGNTPGGGVNHPFASGILETDNNGRFHIPARFHFFIPVLQTSPETWVDMVYSPTTHNCTGMIKCDSNLEMSVHKVTLADASNDLERRERVVDSLIDTLEFGLAAEQNYLTLGKAAPGVKEHLLSALRSEYDFLSRQTFSESSFPSRHRWISLPDIIVQYEKEIKQSDGSQ
jgi:hypothetical protein